jgi:hypothetical protein
MKMISTLLLGLVVLSCSNPLGSNSSAPPAFLSAWDLDAISYFTRVTAANGGVDPISTSDKQNINSFIVGLKADNQWNNVNDVWLLRSTQNVGTGTTAIALKSNAHNGTLIGGPTWGNAGISSTGVGTPPPYIQLAGTTLSNYSQRTIMISFNRIAATADEAYCQTVNYSQYYVGSGAGFKVDQDITWGQYGTYASVGQGTTNGVQTVLTTWYNAGALASYKNGANRISNSIPSSTLTDADTIRLMAMQGGSIGNRGLNGAMSFVMDLSASLSDADAALIYSLYKNTVGQGLGLP